MMEEFIKGKRVDDFCVLWETWNSVYLPNIVFVFLCLFGWKMHYY